MPTTYAKHFQVQKTPQSEPVPGKPMAKNAAGGYAFEIDDWARLRRFLILGTEGGTYYASEREITLANCDTLLRCIAADGCRVVAEIVEVSSKGLAPKNDAAVFALAVASVKGDQPTRTLALGSLDLVCRIGTHLFQFVAAREAAGGGWGRGAKRAVAKWYDRDDLVLQLLKYQQRDGWSHRDLLRLAHPTANEGKSLSTPPFRDRMSVKQWVALKQAAFDAACAPEGGERRGPSRAVNGSPWGASAALKGKPEDVVCALRETPVRGRGLGWAGVDHPLARGYVEAHQLAKMAEKKMANFVPAMADIVEKHRLPRELVPTEFLNEPLVQEAMLPHIGLTALLRNLGNMSKSGLLKPLGSANKAVVARLTDAHGLKKSRVHPFQLLLASRTYAAGKLLKGSGTWAVVPEIVDALDEAFKLSFGNVEPTGKRHLLGIDVSSSMGWAGQGGVSCAEGAAAMAMATVWAEPTCYAFGFSTDFRDLGITRKSTLQSVLRTTQTGTFGGTDCSVAIRHAIVHKLEVDAFVVYTDNETWAGEQHACQALQQYRKESGIPAKLAVVAFTASNTTVRDVSDPGSMDFVGLDASLPQALRAFVGEG